MNVLNADEVAAMLKISRRTLRDKLSYKPDFPAPLYGRRKPAWAEDALREWMLRSSQRTQNAQK